MTQDEAYALADARYEEIAPLYEQINNERFELDESDIAQGKLIMQIIFYGKQMVEMGNIGRMLIPSFRVF